MKKKISLVVLGIIIIIFFVTGVTAWKGFLYDYFVNVGIYFSVVDEVHGPLLAPIVGMQLCEIDSDCIYVPKKGCDVCCDRVVVSKEGKTGYDEWNPPRCFKDEFISSVRCQCDVLNTVYDHPYCNGGVCTKNKPIDYTNERELEYLRVHAPNEPETALLEVGVTPVQNKTSQSEEILFSEDFSLLAKNIIQSSVCEKGGYDMTPYSGSEVLIVPVNIKETYQGEPLQANIINVYSPSDTTVCVYISVREDDMVTSKMFPIHDPLIQ